MFLIVVFACLESFLIPCLSVLLELGYQPCLASTQYRFLEKVFKGLATSGKNLNGWF